MAKILVVDDLAENRLLIVTLVTSQGHHPLEAQDGAQALALVRQEHPALVISDILMPTMDGYEFVRQLRADPALAATQVIFYSAHYREREARNLARECGVAHVLIKPCEPEDILTAVEQALNHTMPPEPPPDNPDFGSRHLRLLTNTLSKKVAELEAVNRRLAALTDLNLQLASEHSPPLLLEKVCRGARDLIGSQYAVVCANGKDRTAMVFATSGIDSGLRSQLECPTLNNGLLGRALSERRAYRITTRSADATEIGLPPGYPPMRCALVAPIESIAQAYGWICLANKLGETEFSLEDEQILSNLAGQIGRIYENGSLYVEVQQHAEKLQAETAQRKRATNELRTSEAGLRRAQILAKLTHIITGPDGVVESWPSTMPDMLGLTPENMVKSAREWLSLVHPDDLALFRNAAISASKHDARTDFEYRLRRADGAWLNVRQVMEPIHELTPHDGGVRWFTTLQDITDQKQAQDELRESDQRFSNMLDNVELLSLMLDREGRLTYCNDYLLQQTGWTRQEVLGQNWFDYFTPPEQTRVRKLFQEFLNGTAVAGHFENEMLTRAGQRRLIRWSNTVLHSAAGEITGTASIGEDITDRKDAERKIRRPTASMPCSAASTR